MTDFVIEHIRERLRRLASQQDMLTCEHMLEGADEIERLELLAVNRLIEIDRLLADRDAERKIYNDAIARHLADVERLERHVEDLRELRGFDSVKIEQLEAEVKEWRTGERP